MYTLSAPLRCSPEQPRGCCSTLRLAPGKEKKDQEEKRKLGKGILDITIVSSGSGSVVVSHSYRYNLTLSHTFSSLIEPRVSS